MTRINYLLKLVYCISHLIYTTLIMKLALDFEVQKWLCQLGVLKPSQAKSNGKVELDESNSKLFLNGLKIGEALVKLVEPRGIVSFIITRSISTR